MKGNIILMNEVMISFIIPVYNREKYIGGLCENLLKINREDVEFIFVNDGSTDSTASIIEKFRLNDGRVHVINKENKGVSSARNVGISNSKGKYISFVDSDDLIVLDLLEKALLCLNTEKDLYIFPIERIENDKKYILRPAGIDKCLSASNLYEYRARKDILNYSFAQFYKRDCIVSNEIIFNESVQIGEDRIFVLRVASVISTFEYIDLAFYQYINNAESAMNTKRLRVFDDSIFVYEELERQLGKKIAVDIAFKEFRTNLVNQIFNVENARIIDKLSEKKIKDYIRYLAKNTSEKHISTYLIKLNMISVLVELYAFVKTIKTLPKAIRKRYGSIN